MTDLPTAIRTARTAAGLTQRALAAELGRLGHNRTGAAVSLWETGDSIPTSAALLALASILDLDLSTITVSTHGGL